MPDRIHDDEPDTGEPVVRALLAAELPEWADASLRHVAASGTDNTMWRIAVAAGRDAVVRLPRRPSAAAGTLREASTLRQLVGQPLATAVDVPRLRHLGQPHDVFPHHWMVLDWIDGRDAWTARDELDRRGLDDLALDLAGAVTAIGDSDIDGLEWRTPGTRGGPLGALLESLDRWLQDPRWNAASLVDVAAVRRLAAEASELIGEPVVEGVVHGDLIPGNLLVAEGRLTSIIDWGGAGRGDVAQDLAPAWAVLTAAERPAFREAVGADDAAWIRGRTFELEHAVGAVVYYVPKRHPLGDVMSRTLDRILTAT